MATCLAFVFLGLVEFAYVNVLTRVENRRPQGEVRRAMSKEKGATVSNGQTTGDPNVSDEPTECSDVSFYRYENQNYFTRM